MRRERDKRNYTREEVWEIIQGIHDDLVGKLEEFILGENGLTEEDINRYFDNYDYEL